MSLILSLEYDTHIFYKYRVIDVGIYGFSLALLFLFLSWNAQKLCDYEFNVTEWPRVLVTKKTSCVFVNRDNFHQRKKSGFVGAWT